MNQIDLDALAQEFNMDIDEALSDVAIPIEDLEATETSDPDKTLSTNINKANAILDRVMAEINRTGMSPRLGEVASQLLTTINQAVGQIYTKNFDMGGLRLRTKMVELKAREVKLKELTANFGNRGGTVNQNLIVTDRETVLKMLRESKAEIKMLEETNNVEDKGDEYDGN
jgi:hypothetical protein